MTQIIKEYGRAIIAAISAIMIISLLAAVFLDERGEVSEMIGGFISRYIGEDTHGRGELAMAMGRSMERSTGNIELRKTAKKGITYTLGDLCKYEDSDITDARIVSVTGYDGFDITQHVCSDRDEITFFDEGVYHITVCMWNGDGIRSMRKMYLGVSG